jgi:hypothetical protein
MSGSRSSLGAWSLVLGMLSVATLPLAVVATRYSGSYDLLHAGFAIPVGIALGIGALVLARRAGRAASLDLSGSVGDTRPRAGRILAILGISIASASTVSLAVYGFLTYLGDR